MLNNFYILQGIARFILYFTADVILLGKKG